MDDITKEAPPKGLELFDKLVVIGIGVVLGLVASFLISLFAGWIEFAC